MEVSWKQKLDLPCDPAILLLFIYPKEMKSAYEIPALRCNMVCMYILGYYSVMKNEIISFATKWMELEVTMLSEICQTQNYKHHMF